MSKNATDIKQNIFNSTNCLSNEQLLAYAEDTLSSVDKHTIEKHLLDCPLCSEAVEGFLERNNVQETKTIIEALSTDLNKKLLNKKFSSWKRYIYSIAATLILFAGLLFVNQFGTSESQKIFDAYFEPYPNTVPILRGDTDLNDIQIAMIEYEKNNYIDAIKHYKKILSQNINQVEANFYSGVSYLCLENPIKAIPFLTYTQKIDSTIFINATHWYLGLAYLLKEDIVPAKAQLKYLTQTENKYAEKSSEIMKLLE